jgi:hypothetical protein
VTNFFADFLIIWHYSLTFFTDFVEWFIHSFHVAYYDALI